MISRLMLGTVQFGLNYGIANRNGQVPYAEVVKILDMAIRAGVTCLDTAASYGNSEEVLGRALTELGVAEEVQVISKVPTLPTGVASDELRVQIQATVSRSLERLRVNSLQACLFHNEDDLPHLPLLLEACQRGAARHVGVSLNAKRLTLLPDGCTAVQIPMNMLDIRYAAWSEAQTQTHLYARSAYLQGLLLLEETEIPAALADLVPVIAGFSAIRTKYGYSRQDFIFVICYRCRVSPTLFLGLIPWLSWRKI